MKWIVLVLIGLITLSGCSVNPSQMEINPAYNCIIDFGSNRQIFTGDAPEACIDLCNDYNGVVYKYSKWITKCFAELERIK